MRCVLAVVALVLATCCAETYNTWIDVVIDSGQSGTSAAPRKATGNNNNNDDGSTTISRRMFFSTAVYGGRAVLWGLSTCN